MRVLFVVFTTMACFSLPSAFAQQPQRENPATQPGAAGQKQGTQAGVTGGQPVPGQTGQAQQGQVGNTRQAGQAGQPLHQAGGSADQQIAACVYCEASNEIEIAKLGQSKAQSEEVRSFAQQMVKDHSPGRDEMKQNAGPLAADASQQSRPQVGRQVEGGQLDWMSVKKEIGQQCLESTKEELSSKQGADFDKCFIGQQIGAHMKTIDELKVLRNYASSDLAQKLDQEMQMAKHHWQLAKQIEQGLKDAGGEKAPRKEENK